MCFYISNLGKNKKSRKSETLLFSFYWKPYVLIIFPLGVWIANKTNLQFYTGNYKQINWLLDEFIDQEVTLEVAFCDWNNKSVYRLVLLAIHTPNGKIINTYGFQ